jgi:hypothetical protein
MTTAEAAVLPETGRTTDHKSKNFGTSVLPASYSQTTPAARGFRDSRVTCVTEDPPACGLGRGHGRPARHDPNPSASCRCHAPMIWVTGVPPASSFGKRASRPFPLGLVAPVTPQPHPPRAGSSTPE